MEKKKDILNGLRKSQKPLVPDGFYAQFWTDLMQRIENESGFLGQLKKTEKPAVPEDFFANLMQGIGEEEEKSGPLDLLSKSNQPTLLVNYFEQSTDRIMAAVKADDKGNKKGGRVINMRIVTIISAVAAALLIIFTVANFSGDGNDERIAENPIETDFDAALEEEENYDDYLAYLDEDEIIDYIIENDIEIEDSVTVDYEDYSEFSEEDIEDYYLDLL